MTAARHWDVEASELQLRGWAQEVQYLGRVFRLARIVRDREGDVEYGEYAAPYRSEEHPAINLKIWND